MDWIDWISWVALTTCECIVVMAFWTGIILAAIALRFLVHEAKLRMEDSWPL